jgi:hypothetical protein
VKRRHFLPLLGVALLPIVTPWKAALAKVASSPVTLLSAPLELGGNWGDSALADVAVVIERMRAAVLSGAALLSDRQPRNLRVDAGADRYPSVRLQDGAPATARLSVVVGTRDWCKLAYQFGHELGHVYCNSWQPDATPRNPSQWLEEALVEGFSIRGLALLANDWAKAPPFVNDAGFAGSIREYREAILARYRSTARQQGMEAGFRNWWEARATFFERHGGVDAAQAAVPTMLHLLESDTVAIADMGALNRWPERSALPVHDYLARWSSSCTELNAPGRLPLRIRKLLAAR